MAFNSRPFLKKVQSIGKVTIEFNPGMLVNHKSNILHSHPNSHCQYMFNSQRRLKVFHPNQEGRELAKLLPKSGFDNMIRIRPKTGQIVIFPSYVLHSVYPNSSNQDRITIAFNSLLLKEKSPKVHMSS